MSVFQSRNAQVLGGVVVAAVVVVAGYLLFVPILTTDADLSETAQPAAQSAAAPEPAEPETSAEPETVAESAEQTPQKPSFDEVRRDADGVTVIAGRAGQRGQGGQQRSRDCDDHRR